MKTNPISEAIVALLNPHAKEGERFYAEILCEMRRILNPKLPYCAGVCIKDKIELHINPDMFNVLSLEERVDTLKHECEHILRDHIPRGKELMPEVFQKTEHKDYATEEEAIEAAADNQVKNMQHLTFNVAADCAINWHLPNLNENCPRPKMYNQPDNQTMEYYFEHIKDHPKLKQQMGMEDTHSLWKESTGAKEFIKEKIRQAVNKAAKRTKAAGKLTADQELLVEYFNGGNKVNWKQELRRFVARTIETKVESSRKKRNRRYGIMFPGQVKMEDLHIGVAKDSSGSVSDEAYVQFMKEIDNIAKFAKVTMLDADAEVKNVEEYKKGMKVTRKGYGGTAYQPALDYFSKDKTVDGVIYFGDMDCYDNEELVKPKYKVLWAIVGDQKPPAEWGDKIYIDVSDKD